MAALLKERDLAFLLYEVLDTESLLSRPCFSEHSRETFDSILDTARQIAEKYFAPFAHKGDDQEPHLDNGKVRLIPEAQAAWTAYSKAGFLKAGFKHEDDGLQLPRVIEDACAVYFNSATVGLAAYPMLTRGAAELVETFGSAEQRATYFKPMVDGRWSGTMALTEPSQGSALADIKTRAEPKPDGSYRIFGSKMFISGGDHELTENIVHLVLARIAGAPAGTKGISLFIVPKFLPDGNGGIGRRNDVALAGLLHKMGWRHTSSTALTFGENEGAEGFLVGQPHQGLNYMFQMMNGARIGVGLFAAGIAYSGYLYSLEYARQRIQGRLPSNRDYTSPQVRLIEHPDVRRLLLAQKSYAEGALAMCLYVSTLVDNAKSHPDEETRRDAALLLDLVTPVVKSWPSRYGAQANDYAIQVLGGAGYIREHPVERLYRDQRLNQIHEGAEAIHGLDLLGRKVAMHGGQVLRVFQRTLTESITQAMDLPDLRAMAKSVESRSSALIETTLHLIDELQRNPCLALANATIYLDAFGRVFAAWIWLKQAIAAHRGLASEGADLDFYRGKLQAARYYVEWELPTVDAQFELLADLNRLPMDMQDQWY